MVRISGVRRQLKPIEWKGTPRFIVAEDSMVEHVIAVIGDEEFPSWKMGFQTTCRKFMALSRVFLPYKIDEPKGLAIKFHETQQIGYPNLGN